MYHLQVPLHLAHLSLDATYLVQKSNLCLMKLLTCWVCHLCCVRHSSSLVFYVQQEVP